MRIYSKKTSHNIRTCSLYSGAQLSPSLSLQSSAAQETKRRPGETPDRRLYAVVVARALVLAGAGQLAEANIGFLSDRALRLGQVLPDLLGVSRLAGDHQTTGL
jgi:hypothetical protein